MSSDNGSSGSKTKTDSRKTTVTSDNGETPDSQKASIPPKNDTDDPDIDQPNASGSSVQLISYQQKNGNLTLVSRVSSSISDGTCTYSFSSEGAKPIVRSTKVMSSNCTIEIPEVEFEKLGVWKVHTDYSSGSKTITESDDAITIN